MSGVDESTAWSVFLKVLRQPADFGVLGWCTMFALITS